MMLHAFVRNRHFLGADKKRTRYSKLNQAIVKTSIPLKMSLYSYRLGRVLITVLTVERTIKNVDTKEMIYR